MTGQPGYTVSVLCKIAPRERLRVRPQGRAKLVIGLIAHRSAKRWEGRGRAGYKSAIMPAQCFAIFLFLCETCPAMNLSYRRFKLPSLLKALMAWLLLALPYSVFASYKSPAKCLGNFCITADSKTYKSFIKEYGHGLSHSGDAEGSKVICFYDQGQRLWIEFEFSSIEHKSHNIQMTGIFVTTIPMCATTFKPKKALPLLVSEYGIGIGDTESKIIGRMGPPLRRDDVVSLEKDDPDLTKDNRYASKFGKKRLVYNADPSSLLFNFYCLEGDKVTGIWIADTE